MVTSDWHELTGLAFCGNIWVHQGGLLSLSRYPIRTHDDIDSIIRQRNTTRSIWDGFFVAHDVASVTMMFDIRFRTLGSMALGLFLFITCSIEHL